MSRIVVSFRRVILDSQEYGSTDEHMVSRVFFGMAVDGKPAGDFYADLKQTVGTSYVSGSIEVGPPTGEADGRHYRGPFNQQAFAAGATEYFRGLVGEHGKLIGLGPGASNVRMRTIGLEGRHAYEFEAGGPPEGRTW